ncbi:hypothetical protein Taro_022844, partial [Colocasia esculenta]|nr:hypothetical protein [Colocasia esculenta]
VLVVPGFPIASRCRDRSTGRDSVPSFRSSDACQGGRQGGGSCVVSRHCGACVEQGGGGQSNVKGPIGVRSSFKVCGFPVRFVWVLQESCNCCRSASVASVVARCVRAVVARLAVDLLAVVFPVWRMLAGKSRCGALGSLRRIWGI